MVGGKACSNLGTQKQHMQTAPPRGAKSNLLIVSVSWVFSALSSRNGRIRCPIWGGPVLELENLEFIT
jgi:hypothetical protein